MIDGMTELILLKAQITRIRDSLQTTITQFRKGEDIAGMENLLTVESELEHLVETDRNLKQPQIDLNQLIPTLKQLNLYIQNKDITGIADLLEDSFCPLTEELLKGCGET